MSYFISLSSHSTYLIENRLLNYDSHFCHCLAFWSYLRTYLRSWVLPEKLPIMQPFRKFPEILRNPKVHHRVHKSPPLVPILSQFDSDHTIPSYLSKIHLNIVQPPTSWVFLVVSFLLAFPPISYMHSPSPPFVLHALPISSSFTWSF
jgi:hypothetical protein